KTRRSPEQATVIVARQHDHDRIGAGKMLGLASGAVAPPASADKFRRKAAIRAKAVARMPVQHGFSLGNRRKVIGGDKALHRDRAQISYVEIITGLEGLCSLRREPMTKPRCSVKQAKEDRFCSGRQCVGFAECEQWLIEWRALRHHNPVAPD